MLRTGSVSAKPVSLVATRFQRARAIAKRAISTAPPVSTIAVVAEAARGVYEAEALRRLRTKSDTQLGRALGSEETNLLRRQRRQLGKIATESIARLKRMKGPIETSLRREYYYSTTKN